MEFRSFDAEYVRQLAAGDPETETHFHAYFSQFLSLKLRSRRFDPDRAADIRQETLFRVLKTLRKGNGVAQPERFGAFVNSVCNNVVLEGFRGAGRETPEEPGRELRDHGVDLDRGLVSAERKKLVREILDELPERDREVLRLVFFEEMDREEICARMGVEAAHLRVVLHRAKERFLTAGQRGGRLAAHAMVWFLLLFCNGMAVRVTTG